jgi:hypothetical protein
MIPLIIVISVLIVVLFFVALVSLIFLIVSAVNKNASKVKKNRIIFFSSLAVFLILTGLDIYLIASYLYTNRNEIINKTVEKSADILSNGLALTASNFEKNWDKNLLKKFEKLEISISSSKFKIENGNKKYQIDLIFNNKNLPEVKIYLHDLIENNYLVSCDDKDLVYILNLNITKNDTDKIPVGKTKHSFEVNIPKDINLKYIRFVHKNIILPE